jgi:uncharacterized protein
VKIISAILRLRNRRSQIGGFIQKRYNTGISRGSKVKNVQKFNFSLDMRFVCLVLLTVVVGMLAVWQPWSASAKRTISVSGESTVKAEPDQYVFSPMYQKKGTDRTAIQTELTSTINTVVAKLKEIGVAEADITLMSSTYDNFYNDGTNEITSNSLTVTVASKDLSQKVQDYLLTTSPQGQVSPMPSFSTSKRKMLEPEARSKAVDDAHTKAVQMAKDLGARLGKIVSISDQTSGYPMPMYSVMDSAKTMSVVGEAGTAVSSMPVLGGRQEISGSVQVVYELR